MLSRFYEISRLTERRRSARRPWRKQLAGALGA